ncbi:MFS transporter [Streptomyces termitum]|uniref:MFS transporter n=1 Tax=Streptomyces termitum TaxID=67368 RepID=A0A918T067_9ACTN|nr:MFS transporter [Streptomyces termitum]
MSASSAVSSPHRGTAPAGRLPAVLLMVGSCLPVLGAVLLAPVLPRIQDHFAHVPGSEALVPVMLTIPALSLALLAPFAGVIVDRLGRKRLLIAATALYAVFGTAPLWLDSLPAIIASRVLVGITEAAIMTACTTLIGDYYSGELRDRYLALQTMCAAISATLFFVVGGALGAADWRAPFWLYAVGLLIAPVMARALPAPSSPHGEAPGEPEAVRRPFPIRRMAGVCLITVFGAAVFYTVPVEMAYLLDDVGVESTGVIGAVTAGASAATVLGSVLFTRVPQRLRHHLPALFALCAAGFLIMGLADGLPLLVVGAVVNCVGTGLLLPSLVTRAMGRLAFADRGRGMGLWTASFFLGQFLCPLVLLAAKGAVGGLATAVAFFGVATALLGAALLPSHRAPAPAADAPAKTEPEPEPAS